MPANSDVTPSFLTTERSASLPRARRRRGSARVRADSRARGLVIPCTVRNYPAPRGWPKLHPPAQYVQRVDNSLCSHPGHASNHGEKSQGGLKSTVGSGSAPAPRSDHLCFAPEESSGSWVSKGHAPLSSGAVLEID
jgi:hypothetical protein